MTICGVRVRFAPSPTGPLHIGGLRTALFNYLFAKRHRGKCLLRIEDTDQARTVPEAEEHLLTSLKWIGLPYDEPFVRQSGRKAWYQCCADQLIREGKAYYAFDTPEELELMRKRLHHEKAFHQHYNALTRTGMRNSLTLSKEECQQLMDKGVPYVVRFKVNPKESLVFHDLLRGKMQVHASTLEDKVLVKSDGMPTYHLANVADDHDMRVSHVIRGEEWLPSTALHELLYRALGWDTPQWLHLPLILKPSGKGKLSKRETQAQQLPIYPVAWKGQKGFRELGFLPEALLNFLATLGYTPPKASQEMLTLQELSETFDPQGLSKTGAQYDYERALWFNQQYLQRAEPQQLSRLLAKNHTQELPAELLNTPQQWPDICRLMQTRVSLLPDLLRKFPLPRIPNGLPKEELDYLKAAIRQLQAGEKPSPRQDMSLGKSMKWIRKTLTGQNTGPDLKELVKLLLTSPSPLP